ncbi:MAG: PD-(D/E)XK nuclease family protein [bacterium]|nr:PD-(D/E)XK nuclease family protein [bacterium]
MNPFRSSFQFTQSKLQDYVECARRFEARYLERLKWPAVETEPIAERERHMREGAAFHHLVQQHLAGVPVEALSRTASSDPLRRWWDAYLRSDFIKTLPIQHSVETELSVPMQTHQPRGVHRLLAKFDLLAIEPGRAVIVDWKTGERRPRREDLARRMQTVVYPYVLALAGAAFNNGQPILPEQIEMIYWFAEDPSNPERFPYSVAQFQRDGDLLNGLIAEILTREDFPLTEDLYKCRYCVYRSLCRRGVEAGDFREQDALNPGEGQEEGEGVNTDLNLDFDQIAEVEF